MNNFDIIGKITNLRIEDKKTAVITLSVTRNYKNDEGFYETDDISVCLKDSIKENVKKYCNIGDIIAIRGTIQTHDKYIIKLLATRVSFLTNRQTIDELEAEKKEA